MKMSKLGRSWKTNVLFHFVFPPIASGSTGWRILEVSCEIMICFRPWSEYYRAPTFVVSLGVDVSGTATLSLCRPRASSRWRFSSVPCCTFKRWFGTFWIFLGFLRKDTRHTVYVVAVLIICCAVSSAQYLWYVFAGLHVAWRRLQPTLNKQRWKLPVERWVKY